MDNGKKTAAHEKKLPWELIEEILSRVPLKSLVRFRTVCKLWSTLFDDKTFINNHKSTFRFILATESKIYSVSIDPKIVVRELTMDIPGLESQIAKQLFDCGEFLVCNMDKEAVVWNPWLKQTRWIKADVSQTSYQIDGIGYDSKRSVDGKAYKTIGTYFNESDHSFGTCWIIHHLASDAWKEDYEWKPCDASEEEIVEATLLTRSGVSFNGNLFWVAYYDETDPSYHLTNFDFSRERFSDFFCYLPCGMKDPRDALVLTVFEGDRFSLLNQCYETKKVEIWVTKNKINVEDHYDVVWMCFMTLSIPNFPGLVQTGLSRSYSQPSYFIDDERLVVCSCDETGQAWIYVVEENKLISKVQINSLVDPWPLHCTCFPSLVPVPRAQREEEAESQMACLYGEEEVLCALLFSATTVASGVTSVMGLLGCSLCFRPISVFSVMGSSSLSRPSVCNFVFGIQTCLSVLVDT